MSHSLQEQSTRARRDDPVSDVDQHVLALIRDGDRDTWNDFVVSYHSRLISFTSRQVDQIATAEDIVQETFVAFLRMLDRFRQDCDIETFLFQILRRRIVDYYRSKGRQFQIQTCGTIEEVVKDGNSSLVSSPRASDPAFDLEQSEYIEESERILSGAIRSACTRLRRGKKFRDLKIAEGTLYAGLSNPEMANRLGCKPNEVAVVKHRLISRLAATVQEGGIDSHAGPIVLSEELLATTWNRLRPSCPKRTTLGKYLLQLLPDDWQSYVAFHVQQLQCQFCLANTDELAAVTLESNTDVTARILQSTIGFLRGSDSQMA